MKKITFTILFTAIAFYSFAQTNALTDSGDEVVLHDDGTWTYVNEDILESKEILLNETPFEKGKKSSFLVKSKKVNVGIWINPKNWRFKKGDNDDPSEFSFSSKKGEDFYGMLISEKIEISLEALKNIAITNAKDAAPDIEVIKEEYRIVNGVKVLVLQMVGTIQGLKFIYYGYYFSSKNGTIQFLTYTSQSLFDEYEKDLEELLNGFVEI